MLFVESDEVTTIYLFDLTMSCNAVPIIINLVW